MASRGSNEDNLRARNIGYVSILHVFAAHLDIVAEAVGVPRKRSTKHASQDREHTGKRGPVFKLASPPRGSSLRTPPHAIDGTPKLRETFGPPGRRGRERSRSVDRGTDYLVGPASTEADNDSCVLM
ncbi:hypothetical protein Y032_0317g2303 [Ancylostoma ceylanicum]|uniref:Uncharacterized protein n=1 Tax=Ancylostoma ceylanicum TaxID=53326 RepID=A0A016S129_9BILA|nr:hypothetical protein Y032_0317g2303 [Ancylostoma ceylanicum]